MGVFEHVGIVVLLDILRHLELLALAAVRNLLDLVYETVHMFIFVEFWMQFFQ